MKNISRRVFIKGMAVAAVATAASTVLTGCKLPVGTEETVVVPGFASETKTLTVDEQDVVITTTGFGYKADGTLVVDLTVVNNGDAEIQLATDGNTNSASYVAFSAYFDGQYNKKATITTSSGAKVAASDDKVNNTYKATLSFDPNTEPEKWNSLTLVVARKGKDGVKEMTFVLNK